jgi:hypothetical protein
MAIPIKINKHHLTKWNIYIAQEAVPKRKLKFFHVVKSNYFGRTMQKVGEHWTSLKWRKKSMC